MSQSRTLKIANATLVMTAVGGNSLSVLLDRARLIIGRESDCELKLTDELCGRHHAVILSDDYTVRIRDLGSQTGTFVNGQQIRAAIVLQDADEIRIGTTKMVVRYTESGRLRPGASALVVHTETPSAVSPHRPARILF